MRWVLSCLWLLLVVPVEAQKGVEDAKASAYAAVTLGPWELMYREDVQADLGLTPEIRVRLKEIRNEGYVEGTRIHRESPKEEVRDKILALNAAQQGKVEALVSAEQRARLRQIQLQLIGGAAALEPDVAAQLNVTEEQRARFREIQERRIAETKAIMDRVRARQLTVSRAMAEMTKRNLEFDDELRKVLTEEQQTMLKSMLGKPFVPTPVPGKRGG